MVAAPPVLGSEPAGLSSLSFSVFEQAPLPIAAVAGAGHIVRYANPAFCRLVNKTREQLVGKSFRELVTDGGECLKSFDRVLRTGQPENHTEEEPAEPRPVFWSYSVWPVPGKAGPAGVVIQVIENSLRHERTLAMNEALVLGSVRQHELTAAADSLNLQLQKEITERKATEEALRESEEHYRDLFNSMDEGYCIVEMIFDEQQKPVDWRYLEVNPSFEKHNGLRDATGKRMRELAPDLEAHWFETYGQVALTGRPVRFVSQAKALDDRWFDLYAFRVGGPGSRKVAILFNNITERKLAEQVLKEAREQLASYAANLAKEVTERTAELTATNSQLEAFVYSIAHDLRAPLRSMQGFSELLVAEAGAALSETARNHAGRINKSAQFMDALLLDLLAFSRISQQRVRLVPVNLEPVVASVLARLTKEIQEKHARVESAGPWPAVLAHEPTLAQVLFNLASNALKFVTADVPPVVRLRAEARAGFIRVWVEDHGPGIAPDHQGQIFRLFTRLDGDKYAGTGIGLAIVQKGIERMGGRVGVESAAGHGSRFWFELRPGELERGLPPAAAA